MLHLFEDSHFLNLALECLIIFELSSTQESKVQYPQNDFYTCQGDVMDQFQLDALILACSCYTCHILSTNRIVSLPSHAHMLWLLAFNKVLIWT